jgi:excisionase family DNA binding protein
VNHEDSGGSWSEKWPDGWDSREFVTAAMVAAYLSVHVRTVHRWATVGRLTPHRLAGTRAVRFRRTDVEQLLDPGDGPSESSEGTSS